MAMPHRRKVLLSVCLFGTPVAMTIGFVGIAQQSATEAPAGFNTPSFNSSASISNGIVEPTGDTFARDQNVYEGNETVAGGLGPASIAIRIRIVEQPARLQNSGLVTMMKMAIS